MDYVKKRTHIIGHPRFLKAGPVARDLYDWGMLHAGLLETDGDLDEVSVLASPWGAGGARNRAVADKLVEVGLWEKTETGWRIRKWAEQGNVSKADLEKKREVDRAKKRAQRLRLVPPACPLGTPQGTPQGFVTSTSTSTSSGSSSGGESAREGALPEWFSAAVSSAEMAVGTIDDVSARWHSYVSTRKRKGWAMNHEDAVGWLCDVVRSERARKPPPRADTRQPLRNPEAAEWMRKTGGDL